MKFNYMNTELTKSDIEALLFGLTILPTLDLEDTQEQKELNYLSSCTAGKKLITASPQFSPNEIRVLYSALYVMHCINQDVLQSDISTQQKCHQYLFTINKLLPMFEKLISSYIH